jgi:hypothetical protein
MQPAKEPETAVLHILILHQCKMDHSCFNFSTFGFINVSPGDRYILVLTYTVLIYIHPFDTSGKTRCYVSAGQGESRPYSGYWRMELQ